MTRMIMVPISKMWHPLFACRPEDRHSEARPYVGMLAFAKTWACILHSIIWATRQVQARMACQPVKFGGI